MKIELDHTPPMWSLIKSLSVYKLSLSLEAFIIMIFEDNGPVLVTYVPFLHQIIVCFFVTTVSIVLRGTQFYFLNYNAVHTSMMLVTYQI